MSWLRIDDSFEGHGKVAPLSDAAHRLWMRAACWCKQNHSGGFVPRAMLREISRNLLPQKRLETLAKELVETTAGGLYEFGLWEEADGGWQFHDWRDYQPPDERPTMSRSESASLAGKRSAEARRARTGTAQPRSVERTPNEHRTIPERRSNDVGGRSTNDVRSNDSRTSRTSRPDPDPDPEISETPIQRPDRLRGRETTASESAAAALVCSKPKKPAEPEPDWGEVCRRVRDNPHDAAFLGVERRPEVAEVAKAWFTAVGLSPRRLGVYGRDRGVEAIVSLYADGYCREELLRACELASKDPWCRGNGKGSAGAKGIEAMTPSVVGRLLQSAQHQRQQAANLPPGVAEAIADTNRMREAGEL